MTFEFKATVAQGNNFSQHITNKAFIQLLGSAVGRELKRMDPQVQVLGSDGTFRITVKAKDENDVRLLRLVTQVFDHFGGVGVDELTFTAVGEQP